MEVILNGRSPLQVVVIPATLQDHGCMKHATKRVRFNLKGNVSFKSFPDGSIEAGVTSKSFAKHVFTDIDIENLWYSTRECERMELDAQEMAAFLLTTNGRYQGALETILKASISGVNGSSWAWLLELADMEVIYSGSKRMMRPKCNELSYGEALSLVADASVRGLEKMVIKQLKSESGRLYRECTEENAANAMDIYKQWRDCDDLTDSQKETLLNQHQRESSKISACFARAMAEGDTMAVRKDLSKEAMKKALHLAGYASPPRSVMDAPYFTHATDLLESELKKSNWILTSMDEI